jgi:hypothetical protein
MASSFSLDWWSSCDVWGSYNSFIEYLLFLSSHIHVQLTQWFRLKHKEMCEEWGSACCGILSSYFTTFKRWCWSAKRSFETLGVGSQNWRSWGTIPIEWAIKIQIVSNLNSTNTCNYNYECLYYYCTDFERFDAIFGTAWSSRVDRSDHIFLLCTLLIQNTHHSSHLKFKTTRFLFVYDIWLKRLRVWHVWIQFFLQIKLKVMRMNSILQGKFSHYRVALMTPLHFLVRVVSQLVSLPYVQ